MVSGDMVEQIARGWTLDSRWEGVTRPYTPEDVARLGGSVQIEHTLARIGAYPSEKLPVRHTQTVGPVGI